MELHPLCTLFPRLPEAEFSQLVDDIAANGLREPITTHEGMILDGGNRYRACIEAGVEPEFREFGGDSIVAFVFSANLHRRHLSPGQQAAIVASAQDWARAHGHGGSRKPDQVATLPLETLSGRAALSGASERTQGMADKVARANPELAKQVGRGEVSLPKAVEQVKPATARKLESSGQARDVLAEKDELIDQLRGQIEQLQDAHHEALAIAENAQAILNGEEHKRLMLLESKLRAAETARDRLMTENAQLKRQIRGLQSALAKAERAAA